METIAISKKHSKGLVKELDKTQYFHLGAGHTERADLFNFALALGLRECDPKIIDSKIGFIRTAYVESSMFKYKGIFFDKRISKNESEIDQITNNDLAIIECERYANAGFDQIEHYMNTKVTSESFMYKILNDVDRMHREYFSEIEPSYEEMYGASYTVVEDNDELDEI